MNDLLIQLSNIEKIYQMGDVEVRALRKINLSVSHGEYMAILGPSGSGKSTLMNLLGCLDTPTAGQYILNGRDVSRLTRNELAVVRNQDIGFIFQSFNLLESISALDNVAMPLVYRGVRLQERNNRAKRLLSQVGLSDRFHHKPNELSGGQRQRVAIARALITNPRLILADEPTGNLDSHSGEEIIKMFETFSSEGKTVIIVTHDQKLAKRTQRILSICDGEVETDKATMLHPCLT